MFEVHSLMSGVDVMEKTFQLFRVSISFGELAHAWTGCLLEVFIPSCC